MALAQGVVRREDLDGYIDGKFPIIRVDAEGYVLVRPTQVTDEMVDVAIAAFWQNAVPGPIAPEAREAMRRALQAALGSLPKS